MELLDFLKAYFPVLHSFYVIIDQLTDEFLAIFLLDFYSPVFPASTHMQLFFTVEYVPTNRS